MGRERHDREWWADTTARLFTRQRGRCPVCAEPLTVWQPVARHHRKLRSQGGTDEDVNLLLLHDVCHKQVHDTPALSREQGWIVPSWGDPGDWPVHTLR